MNSKRQFFMTVACLTFFFNVTYSQAVTDSVQWISLEKAGKLFQENQKPILIFLYDNSNDSCQLMQKTTFSNPEVANYINILFYPIKININTKDTLMFFDGKQYANSKKTGEKHDIVTVLGASKTSFPTMVLFNRKANGSIFEGYKNRDDIFRILIYYNESIDENVPFLEWEKQHKIGYPPGQKQIMTHLLVKWKTLPEALELSKTQPKKLILNLYEYNRVSCTLMRTTTFNNPKIAAYLNEKYYMVNIDVFTKDTLSIFGQMYINENKPYKFHQLPIAALEGKMTFPAFIIIDEKGKVLEKFRQYYTPKQLEPFLYYYGENSYKSITYKEFLKKFKPKLNK